MDFSVKPLNWIMSVGVFLTVVPIIYFIVALCLTYAGGIAMSAASFWAVGIIALIGVQTICLGVAAKYLAKVYVEGKRRPIYIAKEAISSGDGKGENKK